jgi:transcriptional regulator with XRE-family HTH domain
MGLSRRIRELRYARGWGPEELAKRAKISRDTLYQIERGNDLKPRPETLKRLARALGVSLAVLLEEMPISSKAVATDMSEAADVLTVPTRPAGLAISSNRAEILMEKLRVLLASSYAKGIALIIEESLGLLPSLRINRSPEAHDDPSHSD